MKIYLSWLQIASQIPKDITIDYGLVSFVDVCNRKTLISDIVKVNDLFLDSWWFAIRTRWLKLSVVDYAKYIQKYWDTYNVIANMDTNSVEETVRHQEFLEKETGKYILPVYHGEDFVKWNYKWFEELCEKYDYIGLWGIAGCSYKKEFIEKYFNFCFNIWIKYKTKFHWFWVTSDFFLKKYPFYSVDSTSWLSVLRFMSISYFKKWKLYPMTAKNGRERLWIDIAKMSRADRLTKSIEAWTKYNNYITTLH